MDESENEIQKLLELYNQYNNDAEIGIQELQEYGKTLNEESINAIIHTSVVKNISPDTVLRGIFEAFSDESNKLITAVIKAALVEIKNWTFLNLDQARQFTLVLCKLVPQVIGPRPSIKFIRLAYKYASHAKDDEKRPVIVEACLSLIPPVFLKMCENPTVVKIKEVEQSCKDHCQSWLNDILTHEIPEFLAAPLIDSFSEMPLTEEQIEQLINNVFSSVGFNHISSIAEALFPAIKKLPKLTYQCLKKLISIALEVEKRDFTGTNPETVRAQCSLIKILFRVSNTSRIALDSLVKILTSPTELPTHFTPFLVSLAFDVSKLNPKIKDATQKFFFEQIKNDYNVVRSRLLTHISSRDYILLNKHSLEQVMLYAIQLSEKNLETNAGNFIEFAFILIDFAKVQTSNKRELGSYSSSFYVESESEFMPEAVRQINLGVMILKECLSTFPSSQTEIFGQIVQRLISNSPNSIYLVQCLDSPENLLEVIDYLQYLELPVVEQLMRYAVPKICGDERLLDRAMMDARKSFFNRTEKAKLNGVAALFYLILPRQEQTFTQIVQAGLDSYDSTSIPAAANEDVRHDIFNLMKRGFTQSEIVQSNIYFFIPFLLQQNPEMSLVIISSFNEKLDSICTKSKEPLSENSNYGFATNFPLIIDSSIPHFLFCLSRCLHILPKQEIGFSQSTQNDWDVISERLKKICEDVSNVDFDYLLEKMDIFQHPDERECIIAIISVLFNHSLTIDKDIALSLFRLYDRIIHKKIEVSKFRKEDLKSDLKFPTFMDISTLKDLFKKLAETNGDYTDNYGIQLYALETARSMISELPELRLEMRVDRLKIAMGLGRVLCDSLEKIKWNEAPAGIRVNNQSLQEILTSCIKNLFMFIFETYQKDTVKRFLQKMSIISVSENITDAHKIFLQQIKVYVRQKNSTLMIDNMCRICESLSLISHREEKNYSTVKKLLLNLISSNSPLAGRIMKLIRYYCGFDLTWMNEFADSIIETISRDDDIEENNVKHCSALQEFINTLNLYLSDIKFAIKNWIPQVTAENSGDSEKSTNFASIFYGYMIQLVEITEKLLTIKFTRFPATYYEGVVKFIKDEYFEMTRLTKQFMNLQLDINPVLNDLLRKVTSEFDEIVINFTIQNQVTQKNKNSRQDKFDALHAPQIYYLMETLRSSIKTLAEKGKIDVDIPDGFCKLKGTDVKLPSSKKKKQKKKIEEELIIDEDEISQATNMLRNSLNPNIINEEIEKENEISIDENVETNDENVDNDDEDVENYDDGNGSVDEGDI